MSSGSGRGQWSVGSVVSASQHREPLQLLMLERFNLNAFCVAPLLSNRFKTEMCAGGSCTTPCLGAWRVLHRCAASPWMQGCSGAQIAARRKSAWRPVMVLLPGCPAMGMIIHLFRPVFSALGCDTQDTPIFCACEAAICMNGTLSIVQESCRAGRDGKAAESTVYVSQDDVRWSSMISRWNKPAHIADRQGARAQKMENYCEEVMCRRRQLLRYFGEYIRDCRNGVDELCDVCTSAQDVHAAKNAANTRMAELRCLTVVNKTCVTRVLNPKPSATQWDVLARVCTWCSVHVPDQFYSHVTPRRRLVVACTCKCTLRVALARC